jgi:flagellar assembly protein FliH
MTHLSNAMSKETQTAYERWELASFGESQPKIKVPEKSVEELVAELRDEARIIGRAEGQAAGYAEGRSAGYAEGMAAAAHEIAVLRKIAESFGTEVAQANDVIAQDMLDLGLDFAKAMLKTALQVRPEIVLPIVGEAIRYLPSLQQPALLHLHPEDTVIIKDHMDDELTKSGWRIVSDPNMQRGGCRIETASNQIDATMPTRWQRLAEALGKESHWLDTES